MDATELADDDQKVLAEKAAQESLKHVFKPKLNTQTAEKPDALVSDLKIKEERKFEKETLINMPSITKVSRDSLDSLLDKLDTQKVEALDTSDIPKVETPIVQTTSVQNLLANLEAKSKSASEPAYPNRSIESGEIIWSGAVKMAGEGSFVGDAYQICGTQLSSTAWKNILSTSLSISGRINHVSATKYIFERMNQKYDIMVIELAPKEGDAESMKSFKRLTSYFLAKERFAVIAVKNPAVKDIYLCPVKRGNTILPVITDLKPTVPVAKITSADRFFATIILSSGYLEKILHSEAKAAKKLEPIPGLTSDSLKSLTSGLEQIGNISLHNFSVPAQNADDLILNSLNPDNIGSLLKDVLSNNKFDF
jgi:hypothetical protein